MTKTDAMLMEEMKKTAEDFACSRLLYELIKKLDATADLEAYRAYLVALLEETNERAERRRGAVV